MAIEGRQAAPQGATRLPSADLECVAEGADGPLQGCVLLGLSNQDGLKRRLGLGLVSKLLLEPYDETGMTK